MEKAKDYCAYAASCGVIPLAPHTIFTQYLNDAVPEQREQGLRMGHELLERCDELWVMGDTISQGMKDEIGLATFLQLPILYVSDDMVKNQKMIRQSDRPLDINDCIPDSSQYNYENQFLVLKPGVSSKGKDMTADDSIWYARNGFGCIYGARGQAVYAENLLTGKYIHWERHDFCGIVKPESLKEWLLDKPVRNEAAEELTKFVTPELISAAKQNHTACGYPFLIGYAPAEGGLHEAFCLDPDPVNLASFIVKMGKERGDLMICTPLDTPFLNTVGMFTDQCVDFDFLQDHLLPVLIPMQMGKTEPQAIKLTEDQNTQAFLDDFEVEDDMELRPEFPAEPGILLVGEILKFLFLIGKFTIHLFKRETRQCIIEPAINRKLRRPRKWISRICCQLQIVMNCDNGFQKITIRKMNVG